MKFGKVPLVRAVKRLSEAVGYLELGMVQQALASLDRITEPGPLAPMVELLRGEAARLENRLDEAANSFEMAALMLPTPHNKPIWLALSMFYRQAGDTDRAIETLAHARGAHPPTARPKAN